MLSILSSAVFAILAQGSAQATATASAEPVDPLDKIVCKRTLETGSLIKGKKVCITRRQWNKVAEEGRAMGQEMQDANSRIVGNN
jgi:hypothetical protein